MVDDFVCKVCGREAVRIQRVSDEPIVEEFFCKVHIPDLKGEVSKREPERVDSVLKVESPNGKTNQSDDILVNSSDGQEVIIPEKPDVEVMGDLDD